MYTGQPGLPKDLSTHFDVIIFPAGTASIMQKYVPTYLPTYLHTHLPTYLHSQHRRLSEDDSIDRLKDFIRHGGGYLGFCAGAYLASLPPQEGGVGLGLLDAR